MDQKYLQETKPLKNYYLWVTSALKGYGDGVTPSIHSVVGKSSPGTGEKLKFCSKLAVRRNTFDLARTSPKHL